MWRSSGQEAGAPAFLESSGWRISLTRSTSRWWASRADREPCSAGREFGSDRTDGWRPGARTSIFLRMTPLRLRPRLALVLGTATSLACAETAAPPPAPEEVIVVLNTTGATLSLIPVAAPTQVSTIPLGASDVQPVSVTARGATAIVPLRARDAIAIVDLGEGQL